MEIPTLSVWLLHEWRAHHTSTRHRTHTADYAGPHQYCGLAWAKNTRTSGSRDTHTHPHCFNACSFPPNSAVHSAKKKKQERRIRSCTWLPQPHLGEEGTWEGGVHWWWRSIPGRGWAYMENCRWRETPPIGAAAVNSQLGGCAGERGDRIASLLTVLFGGVPPPCALSLCNGTPVLSSPPLRVCLNRIPVCVCECVCASARPDTCLCGFPWCWERVSSFVLRVHFLRPSPFAVTMLLSISLPPSSFLSGAFI